MSKSYTLDCGETMTKWSQRLYVWCQEGKRVLDCEAISSKHCYSFPMDGIMEQSRKHENIVQINEIQIL